MIVHIILLSSLYLFAILKQDVRIILRFNSRLKRMFIYVIIKSGLCVCVLSPIGCRLVTVICLRKVARIPRNAPLCHFDHKEVFMDEFKRILYDLIHAPAFYTALIALVHAVLFYLYPNFPREIVTAADAFIAVIAGIITGAVVNAKRIQRNLNK